MQRRPFLASVFRNVSSRSREARGSTFRSLFQLDADTRILDLGSEAGENIANVLEGTPVTPANIYIADICERAVQKGHEQFGFTPIVIKEDEKLPFEDQFFDIVFCSSVIEHVTVKKGLVWKIKSGREFGRIAHARQTEFAQEIKRLGRQFYVQTPNKYFFIESHSWLPFVGFMSRGLQISVLRLTNRFWIKKTAPDWRLLSVDDMHTLFEEADILVERWLLMNKSIMVVKTLKN